MVRNFNNSITLLCYYFKKMKARNLFISNRALKQVQICLSIKLLVGFHKRNFKKRDDDLSNRCMSTTMIYIHTYIGTHHMQPITTKLQNTCRLFCK